MFIENSRTSALEKKPKRIRMSGVVQFQCNDRNDRTAYAHVMRHAYCTSNRPSPPSINKVHVADSPFHKTPTPTPRSVHPEPQRILTPLLHQTPVGQTKEQRKYSRATRWHTNAHRGHTDVPTTTTSIISPILLIAAHSTFLPPRRRSSGKYVCRKKRTNSTRYSPSTPMPDAAPSCVPQHAPVSHPPAT